jgi:hypothetical protein
MRFLKIFLLTFLLSSCFQSYPFFDKDYYERISGLKLPDHYTVLESFDNLEWLTGTVLQMDSAVPHQFVRANHFNRSQNLWDIRFMGNPYLQNHKADFQNTKNIYFLSGSKEKVSWKYIADLNSGELWAEINYPDWSGK